MLGANWVRYCLLVPGAKCGRAAALQCPATLITGDSLQYADQMEEIWDICGAVPSVAAGYWLHPQIF